MGRAQPIGEKVLTSRDPARTRKVLPTRRYLWLPVVAAVAALLLYVFVFGDTGYVREWTLRGEMTSLEREIRTLSREGDELREMLSGLRNGGPEIERLGRERLGLMRPGEVSYRLVPMDREGWSLDKEPVE